MRENMPFAHHFLFCLLTSVHEYVTATSNNDQDYSKEFTHGGQRGWLIMLYFEGNRLNYVIKFCRQFFWTVLNILRSCCYPFVSSPLNDKMRFSKKILIIFVRDCRFKFQPTILWKLKPHRGLGTRLPSSWKRSRDSLDYKSKVFTNI